MRICLQKKTIFFEIFGVGRQMKKECHFHQNKSMIIKTRNSTRLHSLSVHEIVVVEDGEEKCMSSLLLMIYQIHREEQRAREREEKKLFILIKREEIWSTTLLGKKRTFSNENDGTNEVLTFYRWTSLCLLSIGSLWRIFHLIKYVNRMRIFSIEYMEMGLFKNDVLEREYRMSSREKQTLIT